MKKIELEPALTSHPGQILKEYMEFGGLTQSELAARMGVTQKTVSQLIRHKSPITTRYAERLECIFGRSATFWLSLERKFEERKQRQEANKELLEYQDRLKAFRYNELAKLGYVQKAYTDPDRLRCLMTVLGFGHPSAFNNLDEASVSFAKFRKRATKEYSHSACFSWLSVGRRLSESVFCASYDKAEFVKALSDIHDKFLIGSPDIDGLKEACASAGVALVLVSPLKNLGIYGAAHWAGNKPIIQLSAAYSLDRFWFYFFHEAAHILYDPQGALSVDLKDETDEESEARANQFAEKMLISKETIEKCKNTALTKKALENLAKSERVDMGILVGRLKKEGLLKYTQFPKYSQSLQIKLDSLFDTEEN